ATAGMIGNLGFQSGFTEFNTGRVNMAARWYNPATGQFDNRDTASNNPVPIEANANQYAYANDNPLTGTDPSGNRTCSDPHDCAGDATEGNPGNHSHDPSQDTSGGGGG